MRKITNYVIVFLLTFIVINFNVYAECSYQERKDLLNASKNVEVGYDILTEKKDYIGVDSDSGEEKKITKEEYIIKFYVTNLSDNLYIRYYNSLDYEEHYISIDDLTNGIYFFEDNDYFNLYNYHFEMRSNNSNCLGELFYTKKIIKPIYNTFEMYAICRYEEMQDYKYCKKFITKKFNVGENEFINSANKYYEQFTKVEEKVQQEDLLNIIKNYWYLGVIGIILIILIIVVVRVKKKRSEI